MAEHDDDYSPERAALFEQIVEATAPAPEDLRCRCNLCCYGERPRLALRRDASAA
jgi:hypothetical protein